MSNAECKHDEVLCAERPEWVGVGKQHKERISQKLIDFAGMGENFANEASVTKSI